MLYTRSASGWAWVIVFAAFYEKCISGYSVYGVGFIQIVLMDKFPDDALVISWISAMFMTCHSATGPIAGFIIDKWNCRVAMVTGSLLITISAIITAFTNNIVLVFIFFGLLGGTGIGLMYSTGYIVLAFNFVKKRNIVTGIAVSGCGIGPFILSPVFQIIHQQYGYTGFFLLYAGLNFNACVVGALLRTSELEVTSRIERQRKKALEKTNCCKCDVTVVKNIPLLFIGLAGTFLNMGISMIYLHFPIYAINNYSTEVQVAWFLSIAGICSCVSRILLGMATNTDVISDDVVFFGAYTLLGGVTLCLPLFITSHQAKIAYSVILGTYTGTCYVVINSIVLKLTGPDHVAQGIGYVIAYMGIGTFLGPPVAGFIIENGGSYDISFIIAGFSLILCGFLELGSVCFNTQRYTSPVTEYDYTIAKQENDIMFKQENDTTVTAKQENDTNAMTKQENNTIFKQENDKCIQNEDIRLISPSG